MIRGEHDLRNEQELDAVRSDLFLGDGEKEAFAFKPIKLPEKQIFPECKERMVHELPALIYKLLQR